MWFAPKQAAEKAVPLLVALHTWSGGYTQSGSQLPLANWCLGENWAFIHPHFRGPNWTPEAMGSELAVQDIVSAVEYARENANIDANRIYCVGVSGGGHASLLMAARAPGLWAGVSAWCGISDIETWHRQCRNTRFQRYAGHIEKALGKVPEDSLQARLRSPLHWLGKNRSELPNLDIWHGVMDGRTGSVPFTHSLHAWNQCVDEGNRIPDAEIARAYAEQSFPGSPSTERVCDRDIHFQKNTDKCRITIFEGGHEILQEAALNWLSAQRRDAPAVWKVEPWKSLGGTPTESGK